MEHEIGLAWECSVTRWCNFGAWRNWNCVHALVAGGAGENSVSTIRMLGTSTRVTGGRCLPANRVAEPQERGAVCTLPKESESLLPELKGSLHGSRLCALSGEGQPGKPT